MDPGTGRRGSSRCLRNARNQGIMPSLAIRKRFVLSWRMRKRARSACPISHVLEAFGDSWSLLILRDLILRGKTRYQEFIASEEGISTNILADRLVRLEKQRLITRSRDPRNKKQILYAPTPKALDLLPVMFEMARWGARYNPKTDLSKPLLKRIMTDDKALMKELRSRFGQSARQKRPEVRPHEVDHTRGLAAQHAPSEDAKSARVMEGD